MIGINLLPKDLRRVEHKIVLPYKTYLVVIFALFLFTHFILFSLFVFKKIQIVNFNRIWRRLESQSKDFSSSRGEIKTLESHVDLLKEVLSRKLSTTELLSGLNAAVPRGLWLERFSFSEEGGLFIQGSVVSLTQNEMTIIGKFLQELKNNKLYASIFSKIELNSVQRRTIKTYDVVDFVLVGELKK